MSKKKGDTIEGRAKRILEGMGYAVEKARPVRAWVDGRVISKAHDYWGAFDLIAVKPGARILFVQVSTMNVGIGKKVAQMRDVLARLPPEHAEVHVWRWRAPDRPGQRGAFVIQRWEDDFKYDKRRWVAVDSTCFPWDAPEPRERQVSL